MNNKAKRSSTFKKVGIGAGLVSLGIFLGYFLGTREADKEFYEVEYEDL